MSASAVRFADRLDKVETSAIRELFKLLGKPGIISFAGGFPDVALVDVDGIRAATLAALEQEPAGALQYGATEGYGAAARAAIKLHAVQGCAGGSRSADRDHRQPAGARPAGQDPHLARRQGDRRGPDLPGHPSSASACYGAELVSAPVDGDGVEIDRLEQLIVEHKPKFVYLIPTFGNPSGATLSLERRKRVLEIGGEAPDADRGGRSLWRPVVRRAAAAQPAGAERAGAGQPRLLVHCGSLEQGALGPACAWAG